ACPRVQSAMVRLVPPIQRQYPGFQKFTAEIQVDGWKFHNPAEPKKHFAESLRVETRQSEEHLGTLLTRDEKHRTRQKPPASSVVLKERLLTLLQSPLENLFAGKKIELPFNPFPYQMEGISFLLPRSGALLADEMGLGKTMQTIVSLRLLLHSSEVCRVLIVCPKPLVPNWLNELKLWAPEVPVEVIGGDIVARKVAWTASKCPVKLVNYELLTRDADIILDDQLQFDLVILDEAQRIKNEGNKTAEVAKSLHRQRSWALTGTPIENRPADLINIWSFVQPGEIPRDTPPKELSKLTRDSILRRIKEDVMKDMPAKIIQDVYLELAPAQQEAYDLAEKDGIVHLNDLGETITVQHVFELVMRLKQICNFDPRTGDSVKLEQLVSDMAEVAESNRKAIVFSQWVEPLEIMAQRLREFGPLLYHGKVPHRERQSVLEAFKNDPDKHVILMSYGTGSVGLNLQFSNYVFLFDRWWNPAVEDQAINRAHRIGQKNTVFVKRFVTQNTIECRICEVLERKRQLFEEIIAQSGPPTRLGLSEQEIFGLFHLKPPARRQVA
ncbi:MAG TPA: DEAD/DEAH box helicase, partial [Gemmatales bacterium]|nr:DEAD/DEAH box helicase [Gemmatales bacterium]